MPYKSQAQAGYFHTHKVQLEKQGVNISEWDKATKGRHLPKRVKPKKKIKPKIVVDNKLKGFGETDTNTGVVKINKKRHKGDTKQLADTIKHEIYHVKHPKATEKATYKNTGKLENMSMAEQSKLISKLRMKKLNYSQGAIKRKLHWKGSAKPGDLISKMNESKINRKVNSTNLSKRKLAIMGLV